MLSFGLRKALKLKSATKRLRSKKLNQPIAPQGSQPIKNCASRGGGNSRIP